MIDLAALERLARNATPGPWTVDARPLPEEWRVLGDGGSDGDVVALCDGRRNLNAVCDADYLAACDPATIAALVRAVTAAQAAEHAVEAWFEPDGPIWLEFRDALAAFRSGAAA